MLPLCTVVISNDYFYWSTLARHYHTQCMQIAPEMCFVSCTLCKHDYNILRSDDVVKCCMVCLKSSAVAFVWLLQIHHEPDTATEHWRTITALLWLSGQTMSGLCHLASLENVQSVTETAHSTAVTTTLGPKWCNEWRHTCRTARCPVLILTVIIVRANSQLSRMSGASKPSTENLL